MHTHLPYMNPNEYRNERLNLKYRETIAIYIRKIALRVFAPNSIWVCVWYAECARAVCFADFKIGDRWRYLGNAKYHWTRSSSIEINNAINMTFIFHARINNLSQTSNQFISFAVHLQHFHIRLCDACIFAQLHAIYSNCFTTRHSLRSQLNAWPQIKTTNIDSWSHSEHKWILLSRHRNHHHIHISIRIYSPNDLIKFWWFSINL